MIGRQRDSEEKLARNERGSALVLVALFIFVLFGFAALSLDVSNVYREKHRMHMATDAAALAGVAKLDPSNSVVAQAFAAISEADVIANTNGVMDVEISAGAVGNTGTIEVGQWASGFVAGATPYNAVRVPAQRTVPLNFGKIGGPLGFPAMTPTVASVATIWVPSVPYAVPLGETVPVGSNLTVQVWAPGAWGLLDLCPDAPLNGNKETEAAISNGNCFVTIGQVVSVSNGTQGVPDGWCDRWSTSNLVAVLPVTTDVPNGNHEVTVLDFIVVKLTAKPDPCSGNSGFTAPATVIGQGFNGLRQLGLGPVRSLVE